MKPGSSFSSPAYHANIFKELWKTTLGLWLFKGNNNNKKHLHSLKIYFGFVLIPTDFNTL